MLLACILLYFDICGFLVIVKLRLVRWIFEGVDFSSFLASKNTFFKGIKWLCCLKSIVEVLLWAQQLGIRNSQFSQSFLWHLQSLSQSIVLLDKFKWIAIGITLSIQTKPLFVLWDYSRVHLRRSKLLSRCLCKLSCNLASFTFNVRDSNFFLPVILYLLLLVEICYSMGNFIWKHGICWDWCLPERTFALLIIATWHWW